MIIVVLFSHVKCIHKAVAYPHTPSDADLGEPIVGTISTCTFYTCSLFSCLMGTYIHWVLLFAWVLLFRKWIATGLMGTYIHRVLVLDGTYTPEFMVFIYRLVYGERFSCVIGLDATAGEAR